MTLYRQVIIFAFGLFLILFMGTWFAKLETTRSFLLDQLESHAQDTATSLALSITQHMMPRDMATIESMINAVFDRGYYNAVQLSDVSGAVLVDRTLDVNIHGVPPFFVRWVRLDTPDATAMVMAGWRQTGSIYVKSHPGYAYRTLWDDVVRTTAWFIACGAFVLIAGGFGLRLLLRPLVRIEDQADAICRKEYAIQEKIPRTREFRRVVEAMNRMTVKVKEMFDEQVAQAEGLRERAYKDPVTGLGSRRYFDIQVAARLDHRDSTAKGILLLVSLNDLERLNLEQGFQAGDEFLRRVGLLLREFTRDHASCVLARFTGGDFGIFLPDAPPWDAEKIARSIAGELAQLAPERIAVSDNIGYVGAAAYETAVPLGRMLSEADLALNMARQKGPNGWSVRKITEKADIMPLGKHQWKALLEKAISERRFSHDFQTVVKAGDTSHPVHLEVFSRFLLEDDKVLSAGIFMPLAERLKLVSAIDRIAIEAVMQLDPSRLPVRVIAVNVSPASLQDDAFRQWLHSALKSLPETAPRIIFEFSEYSAVRNLDLLKSVTAFIRDCGHAVGLDHYGQSFSNLGYLQSIRPHYVKIDRAYTGELKEKGSDSRFYIGSLCSVAHSIDIMVVAEGVETDQQLEILRELNVDAIQGYVVDRPKPIQGMLREE